MKKRFLLTELGGEFATPSFYALFENLATLQKRVIKEGLLVTQSYEPLTKSTHPKVLPEEPTSKSNRHTSRRELSLNEITLIQYLGTHGLYECPFIAETTNENHPTFGKDITKNPKYRDSTLAR